MGCNYTADSTAETKGCALDVHCIAKMLMTQYRCVDSNLSSICMLGIWIASTCCHVRVYGHLEPGLWLHSSIDDSMHAFFMQVSSERYCRAA